MRSVEAEGSSIDEAIAKALKALNVERDRVQIEIMSSATRGFLGFGGRKARVRATVRAPLTTGIGGAGAEPEGERDHAANTSSAAMSQGGRAPQPGAKPDPVQEGVAGGAAAERAHAVVSEILRLMGVDGEVSLRADSCGAGVRVEISGKASGLVIGRGGQTLDALEYLVNRILARGGEGCAARVSLDAERYRERHRQALRELAARMAERARRRRRPVTLGPMSPRDRREVHLALQDEPGLTTRSQGQGYYRKLVVVPAAGEGKGPGGAEPEG